MCVYALAPLVHTRPCMSFFPFVLILFSACQFDFFGVVLVLSYISEK